MESSPVETRMQRRYVCAPTWICPERPTQIGEDLKYLLVKDANGSFIVRMNLQPTQTTGLIANRIDELAIYYYDRRVTYTIGSGVITNVRNSAGTAQAEVTPDNAKYIVLLIRVTLPAVGNAGSPGYQPASSNTGDFICHLAQRGSTKLLKQGSEKILGSTIMKHYAINIRSSSPK